MNKKEIREVNVPTEFREDVSKLIIHYTTALIKITRDKDGKEVVTHLGSGTFVVLESHYGILTALHVAELIENDCEIGLTIDTVTHRFTIHSQALNVLKLTKRALESLGPDLAFIKLPNNLIGNIKRTMHFFNLSKHREQLLENPPEINMGWWIACGTPGLGTREEGPSRGYLRSSAYEHFACEAIIAEPFHNGSFDYVDMPIDYTLYHNTPVSLSGMSGGGLWQVLFSVNDEGVPKLTSLLLSGVIFYQTELIENKRSLRSHFRQSVYEFAYGKLTKLLGISDETQSVSND